MPGPQSIYLGFILNPSLQFKGGCTVNFAKFQAFLAAVDHSCPFSYIIVSTLLQTHSSQPP